MGERETVNLKVVGAAATSTHLTPSGAFEDFGERVFSNKESTNMTAWVMHFLCPHRAS
jgi:hypothetical protein